MVCRCLLIAAALAALLAGCGGRSADLFGVEREGSVPDARLQLVVNDGGTVSCDGGADKRLPEDLVIEARELQRDLLEPASQGLRLEPGTGSILRYDVITPDGRVRFADDSRGKPAVLDRFAFFVRKVAQGVCGLPR
jgi:hypothetical protein